METNERQNVSCKNGDQMDNLRVYLKDGTLHMASRDYPPQILYFNCEPQPDQCDVERKMLQPPPSDRTEFR